MGSWWDDEDANAPREATLLRANGDRFRAEVHAHTIKGEDGSNLVHLVAFRDLEAHGRALVDTLEAKWRQIRLIADSVPVLLSYVDRDMRYRFTNKKHGTVLRYDTECIEGRPVRDVLGDKLWAISKPRLLRALQGETVNFTSEVARDDGGVTYLRGTCTPDHDLNGTVQGVFVSAFDVTEIPCAKAESESAAHVLVAAHRAVHALFESGGRADRIHAAFTEVAKSIHADRFCFCRMEPLPSGGLKATKHRAWDAYGSSTKELPTVDFPPDSSILRSLLEGQSVQRRWVEANKEDTAIFDKMEAVSFITVPIFFDDQLWGLLKYDDLHNERTWSESEIKALELASQTIGAALRDRESQEEIRRITRQYRDLSDNAPFCIHELDCDGRFRAISEWGFCALGRKSEKEVIGTSIKDHVHEDDWTHYASMLKKASDGEYCEFEFRLETPNGYAECETTMIPIHGSNGVVTHIMGTTADITARKKAEREAAVMRDRLTRAEAASNVMRCFLGLNSRWKSVPDRLCELLGYTREEMLAGTYAEMTHPEDLKFEKSLKQAVHDRHTDSFEMEKRFIRKDGAPVWVYVSGTMVRDEHGSEDRWLAYIRDISSEKEAEEALRKSKQDLRELAKRLQNVREEDFTRISREVHDELGQSLTALKMDLGWIDRRLQGNEESRNVREKLQRMFEMIDQTIGHVREISTSLRPPILDDLGITGALEQLVSDFSRHTRCRFNRDHDLETLCTTRVHATAIYRIVQEVLTNIARHANAQEVEIGAHRSETGETILTIRDDGIGFDETMLTKGQMLGIVGMRERAIVFGGAIEFAAAPGGGTMVTIRIPQSQMEGSS